MSKENDLEGAQDMGGKHGGQAGEPKPAKRPKATERDADVVEKRAQSLRANRTPSRKAPAK